MCQIWKYNLLRLFFGGHLIAVLITLDHKFKMPEPILSSSKPVKYQRPRRIADKVEVNQEE